VREAVGRVDGKVDGLEDLRESPPVVDPRAQLAPDEARTQRLGDDVADPHPGVERRTGVLEDQLDGRAQEPQLALGTPGDGLALEIDGAAGGLVEAGHQPHEGGLARPGLPHDAEPLAAGHLDADAIEGEHVATGVGEATRERFDLEERLGHACAPSRA